MSTQNDWTGLDQLTQNLPDKLKEFMQEMANIGEAYIKGGQFGASLSFGGHAQWNNDTGSLLTSVTGYEASIGNHRKWFHSEPWETAQREGSKKYRQNTPEHYIPAEGEEIYTSGKDAMAILSVWTRYPDQSSDDKWLFDAVSSTLQEAADIVSQRIPDRLSNFLVTDSDIPISSR